MVLIKLRVNGRSHGVRTAAPDEHALLEALRDQLDLTGTKYGCGEAQCGACTVVLDGRAVRSCITPLGQVKGRGITTIEGLARGSRLHPLQQAFIDEDALQCGYCTPGMIMSALALLGRKSDPSEAEIATALQGNICRCGAQPRIIKAVRRAAAVLRETGGSR